MSRERACAAPSRGRRIVFVLVAITVGVVLLELGARLLLSSLSQNPQRLWMGVSELQRLLFEDRHAIIRQQGIFQVGDDNVNPAAFDATGGPVRGRYVMFRKPQGVRRILVLGASSVYGVATPREQSFPVVLEELLNRRAARQGFEVVNMGTPAIRSRGILERLQPIGLRFEHDMEIFYELNNDFFPLAIVASKSELMRQQVNNVLYQSHVVLNRLSAFYYGVSTLLERIGPPSAASHTIDDLLRGYTENVEAWILTCEGAGAIPLIATEAIDFTYISTTEGRHEAYVATYHKALAALNGVGRKHGVQVVDVVGPLVHQATPLERKAMFYDTVHLTEKGNRRLAELIAQALFERWPEWFS